MDKIFTNLYYLNIDSSINLTCMFVINNEIIDMIVIYSGNILKLYSIAPNIIFHKNDS